MSSVRLNSVQSLTERSSKWILGHVSSVRPKWRSVLDRTLVQEDGEAPLEEMLEEENLEDANLVEAEVKAEP
ncbi:hypothetical protein LR48_Vigan118s002300 [Vigna angularis]|uniref:Uncharacterized protein n=1 Tax=Phaseolus angularis TaxID=3914 RepID=A0A0L9T4S0_PHAAN|nr:hypothetical protein LR48_Vigan118s002300 [Vigna angularis]